MSWPSRMKNGVMIMGQGLARRNPLAPCTATNTRGIPRFRKRDLHGILPDGRSGTFDDAKGWKNLPGVR